MYENYIKRQAQDQRGNVLGFFFAFEVLLCFLLACLFGKTPLERLPTEWQWTTRIIWSALIVTAILWSYVRIFGWPSIDLSSCIVLLIQSSAAACICIETGTIATQTVSMKIWLKLILVLFGYLAIGVMLVHPTRTNRAHAQQRWRQLLVLYAYPPLVFSAVYAFTLWYFNTETTNGLMLLLPMVVLAILELSSGLLIGDAIPSGARQTRRLWLRNKRRGAKTKRSYLSFLRNRSMTRWFLGVD